MESDKIGQGFEIQDQHKWRGQEIETKSDPLIDSGTGKPVLLRQFDFKFDKKLRMIPTKQELFNQAWPLIRPLLWSDGFVASNDVDPRVLVGKRGYKIILVCEPRLRSVLKDKPVNLRDILHTNL